MTKMRKRKRGLILSTAVLICLCFLLCGCGSDTETQTGQENEHKSKEEMDIGYYYYEGLFLPADEVIKIFETVSKDYPRYSIVPDQFHVTTEYLPDITHEDLYGTEVSVHITGYKYGTVEDPADDSTSNNEGFKVELFSDNPEMKELLDSIDKNWHITGSYTTAARYTKYMDFSDAEPIDFTITGKFGRCDSDGNLILEKMSESSTDVDPGIN